MFCFCHVDNVGFDFISLFYIPRFWLKLRLETKYINIYTKVDQMNKMKKMEGGDYSGKVKIICALCIH